MPDKLTLITDLQSLSYNDAIAFINDLPFAYYRADLDGHVLAASAKAVQMFGYDRVEDIINVIYAQKAFIQSGTAPTSMQVEENLFNKAPNI